MNTQTVIILASSKKEAEEIAYIAYKNRATYRRVYAYTPGKGNNFYEFSVVQDMQSLMLAYINDLSARNELVSAFLESEFQKS